MSNCAEVRFHFVKKKTSCFPYCKSEICHGNERIRARPLCTRSNTIKICRIQLVTRWEIFFYKFWKVRRKIFRYFTCSLFLCRNRKEFEKKITKPLIISNAMQAIMNNRSDISLIYKWPRAKTISELLHSVKNNCK